MLSRLFIAALWSPAGKGLISWLSFEMFNCVFVTFPCGILGQVCNLIVSILDLCHFSFFANKLHVFGIADKRFQTTSSLSVPSCQPIVSVGSFSIFDIAWPA